AYKHASHETLARDIISHHHFPQPEVLLRLAQAPKVFVPSPAYPGGLVTQVPFEGVPHFGPAVGRQGPVGPNRLGGQDDLIPHSGQNIARFDTKVKSDRCGLDSMTSAK